MIFTKTEIKVLGLFVSRILDSFSIREAARLIKKDLKIVHTSVKNLEKKGFFIKEKNGLRLNYKNNVQDLAYIENTRKEAFFKKQELVKAYAQDFIRKSKTSFFVLLVFGSYATGKENKNSDIDLLAILPFENEEFERQLNSVLSASTKKFHTNIITEQGFKEMLKKREEVNISNETINNHIILHGAEIYYSLLGERHVR